MAEAGLGGLIGAGVGIWLYKTGEAATLWGVPMSIVWGGAVAVGVFMLFAPLRLITSSE
jgi:hypothetical protein